MPVPPDATEYILTELTRRLNEVASRLEVGMGRMDSTFVDRRSYDADRRTDAALAAAADAALLVTIADLTRSRDEQAAGRRWLVRLSVSTTLAAVGSAVVALVLAASGH